MTFGYILSICTFASIYAILILGLNILTGYTKQVSLGHAAFFAIGAYTQALLVTKAGLTFWSALPLSIALSMTIGVIMGLPSLRVSDDFLVLTTIGLNFIVMGITEYFDFFGGAMGIIGITMPTLWGRPLSTSGYFAITALFLMLALCVSYLFSRTWGRLAMEATGEDEEAAQSLGINTALYKIYAFALSSTFTGLAGVLWAHSIGSVFPRNFSFEMSVLFLSMLVFGGLGTIRGAIFGAFFLYLLPECFRFIENYRMLVYGALLTMIVILQPNGMLGRGGLLDRCFSKLTKKKAENQGIL
ncbi:MULTISPECIES: branched-chain amino acid ABC transporter permease [Acetomicrobium]|jgi:branched-chain amino acid transport system permease protein|uniref:branched-chain amino acid ABC transporter permease n=1 Tax=Acetomicrobium TaxID=49894 RepID=UPI0016AF179D|nr:branched-chain amino acid ABC transporter permease [Acetomicrobium mobile]MDI9377976.1 branched-chain amino acid ABC transporter permease [Synergistota bacterium]NLI43024.1 branched-chain amino acid ABC transporter permease [Synergistaceae bacterium]HOB10417.1 branched-chain amino acid ABC transporter permease [Acetomicrobium sp.]HOM97218.1 branched-chain amino acid ABC transporter permease [Acetomicrobium sp.]HQA36516.1 branched-chain amino acid ABC transporter permease [Acetomicrobium sp.